MKITEREEADFAGRYPVCMVKGSELGKIHEWLYNNYQGYKFAIVFDTEPAEYDCPENPSEYCAGVHFLDELLEECAYYMGIDEAIKRLNELKQKNERKINNENICSKMQD